MKLVAYYKNSYLGRTLSFLFKDDLAIKFPETYIGKLLCKGPTLSETLARVGPFLGQKTPIRHAQGLRKNSHSTCSGSSTKFEIKLHAPFFLILTSILLLWYEAPLEALWAPLGYDFLPFALLLISFFILPKQDWIIRKYHLWYLGFLIAALGAGIIGAILGYGGYEMLWGLGVYLQFGLVIILGNLITKRDNLPLGLVILSLPMVGRGLWEFATGTGGSNYSYLETSGMRVDSYFASPNIFGFVLVVLAISIWSFGHAQDLRHLAMSQEKNQYFLLALIPILALIYLTGSRTAWIALLVAGVVIFWEKGRKFFLYLILSPILLLVPRVRERVLVIFKPEYYFDASIDGRVWSLNNAWHIFQQNIFGTGPGTYGGKVAQMNASPVYLQSMQNGYTALYTTDNQWLSILVQTGILGALSFIGFSVSLANRLISNKKGTGLALMVAFFVMMSFSNALEFGAVILPVGILIGKELAE